MHILNKSKKKTTFSSMAVLVILLAAFIFLIPDASRVLAAAKPSMPLGLVIKSGDKLNKLTWVASLPKPSGYNLYRTNSRGGAYQKINANLIAETNFTDNSYPQLGIYYYRVTAVAQDGTESDPTSSVAPMVVDILSSIKADTGTVIQASTGEIELEIPSGSIGRNLSIRIQEQVEKPKGPEGRILISDVYDCTPGKTKFADDKPAILRIKCRLPSGFNEEGVAIYYYDEGKWYEIKSRFLRGRSMAEARIKHFTFFAVTAKGAKADILRPIVKSAMADSSKTVTISFSESMEEKTLVELTNYEIISEPTLQFAGVMVSEDKQTAILTTTYQTARQQYKIKVHGVKDEAGNTLEDNGKSNTAVFFGGPSPHGNYQQSSYMCAACHRAHTGVGPKAISEIDISTVCYTCHDTSGLGSNQRVQADFVKASVHRLDATKTCTSCHDPHLSFAVSPKLLGIKNSTGIDISSGNEFCFTCHGTSPTSNAPMGDHQTTFAGISHDTNLPEPISGTRIKCVHCHSPHGSDFAYLNRLAEEDLCFSCHRAKGLSPESNLPVVASDIQSGFFGGPENQPSQGVYYKHPTINISGKHSNQEAEQSGSLYSNMEASNRHAECTDCHNTHASTKGATGPPFASPSLRGVSGVGVQNGPAGSKPAYVFKTSLSGQKQVEFEFEVCFKCHSSFNKSLPNPGNDKSIEFNPNNASFHPVEAAGKNKTVAIEKSLSGANMSSGSLIFCASCHSSDSGSKGPHGSKYRHILKAAYREQIKPKVSNNDYKNDDFSLCITCHSDKPFLDTSKSARDDTNFKLHGFHLGGIYNDPARNSITGSDDITVRDAGHGNAICRECHYNNHGVAGSQRLIRFAPNVNGPNGQGDPVFVISNDTGKCRLRCHGKDHENLTY